MIDDFIAGAQEVDVDALADGERVVVAGVMEHIEGAGVHSGDSACITPPVNLSGEVLETLHDYSVKLAQAIGVRGLINIQYVIKDGQVLVIEANPRASRTVPYLSKAIGHPLAKYAALIAAGRTLAELGFTETPKPEVYSAKEVVLPFLKFKNVLPVLGPEMRSTGESMGIDPDPYMAYAKALLGANVKLPSSGIAVVLGDGLDAVKAELGALEFTVTTESTSEEPEYDLLIDTLHTPELRRALEAGLPYVTTLDAARWLVKALRALREPLTVHALQDLARDLETQP